MTSSAVTTYECDRCHVKAVTKDHMEPEGWSDFDIRNSRTYQKTKEGHLCQSCTRHVTAFIEDTPDKDYSEVETRMMVDMTRPDPD